MVQRGTKQLLRLSYEMVFGFFAPWMLKHFNRMYRALCILSFKCMFHLLYS